VSIDLNLVICPGCAESLPIDNEGCPHCKYEEPDTGRIPTLAEIIDVATNAGNTTMFNDVSGAFVARIVDVVRQHYCRMRPMNTVPTDGTSVLVILEEPLLGSRIQAATYKRQGKNSGLMGIVGSNFHFDVPKQVGWLPQPGITDPAHGVVSPSHEEKR